MESGVGKNRGRAAGGDKRNPVRRADENPLLTTPADCRNLLGMQPKFTGLPFFVYPVRDMARSKAFYGGVLGLDAGYALGDKWVEYDVGSSTLALSSIMRGAEPGAKAGAVALETEQFDEAVAHLKENGVKFLLEPIDSGLCRFARFEDPDGNHLILHRKHLLPAS
jgi:predicted enzyme related to lactoylglutathione lyase